MKKITKVSISGIPFMLDNDAEKVLSDYLEALTRKFGNGSENELVSDIENRIAELILERKSDANSVVDLQTIKAIINQIGSVSSIERDSLDTESGVRFNFESQKRHIPKDSCCENSRGFFGNILKAIAWIAIILLGLHLIVFLSAGVCAFFVKDIIGYYTPESTFCLIILTLSSISLITLSFIALFSRAINNGKRIFGKWITILLLLLAGVILGIGSIINGLRVANEYKAEESVTEIIDLDLKGDVLYVVKEGERNFPFDNEGVFGYDFDAFRDSSDSILIPSDFRYIENNENGSYLRIRKSSHGRGIKDAKDRILDIKYDYRICGDTIYLNRSFSVGRQNSYRSGEVDVKIVSSKNIERL